MGDYRRNRPAADLPRLYVVRLGHCLSLDCQKLPFEPTGARTPVRLDVALGLRLDAPGTARRPCWAAPDYPDEPGACPNARARRGAGAMGLAIRAFPNPDRSLTGRLGLLGHGDAGRGVADGAACARTGLRRGCERGRRSTRLYRYPLPAAVGLRMGVAVRSERRRNPPGAGGRPDAAGRE